MSGVAAGLTGFAVLLALMAIRVPIGVAMMTVGVGGYAAWTGVSPLLAFLKTHAVRPEFPCRFTWAEGSLAFWDNRCTQHFAIGDYDGHRREMHRITIAGGTPF